MNSEDLLMHTEGAVATLTLNRSANRNALTRTLLWDLSHALARLAVDSSIRLVVLTGAGNTFSVGGDVSAFAKIDAEVTPSMSFDDRVTEIRMRSEAVRLLHEMPKPTLAVLPGAAAGAGLALALACDHRIAASNARLSTAFSRVGLSGDYGISFFLTKLVSSSRARELMFTGRVLEAEEAMRMGLLDRIADTDHFVEAARDFAKELASLPTVAIGYIKRNLQVAERGSLTDVLDAECMNMVRTFETEDHQEAARAHVERRPPIFRGR